MLSPSLELIPHAGTMGQVVAVSPGSSGLVGRSRRCSLKLPNGAPRVSRIHAVLACREGVWTVTDTSQVGTVVAERLLGRGESSPIGDGVNLRFGSCEYVARLVPWEEGVSAADATEEGENTRPALDSYVLREESISLANINAGKILASVVELPKRLSEARTEADVFRAACDYVRQTLASLGVDVSVVRASKAGGVVEVVARSHEPFPRGEPTFGPPTISRRVVARLANAPDLVVFLRREAEEQSVDATLAASTRSLGACWLENDRDGYPIIMYVVGEHVITSGAQCVAQCLRLVATLVQQHLTIFRRMHLTKYFSPKIVEALLQDGGGNRFGNEPKESVATSLFFDIRGSCESLHGSLAKFADACEDIRTILGIVTDSVFAHDGSVIDYAGDGVFAVWGVPLDQPNQAEFAVRCAKHILQGLQGVQLKRLQAGPGLCGIGIAKGRVRVGDVGAKGLWKYGVQGPSVNMAQRLEAFNKTGNYSPPILIAAEVNEDLSSRRQRTISLGKTALAGIPEEIEIFHVLD